jgi:hypothetical protein
MSNAHVSAMNSSEFTRSPPVINNHSDPIAAAVKAPNNINRASASAVDANCATRTERHALFDVGWTDASAHPRTTNTSAVSTPMSL